MDHYAITVVGAGLTGRAAAVVTARTGRRVLHLAPQGARDARTAALMQPAIQFLQRQSLIEHPGTIGTPLAELRIIDVTGRFPPAPEAHFRAAEAGVEAFGWNIANAALAEALTRVGDTAPALEASPAALHSAQRRDGRWHLTLEGGRRVTTDLLVGADGKGSRVRQAAGLEARRRDYRQSALVCDLELERPLGACSIEFHYPHGPFTLVPAGGHKANLVWIDHTEALEAARADTAGFEDRLTARALRLMGAIRTSTAPVIFPLSHLSVAQPGAAGAVLVGESAHAFPPIGAQGLNLGLRDIAALDEALAAVDRQTPDWADAVARRYARVQGRDMAQTGLFVTSLFGTLVGGRPEQQALRAAGLAALNAFSPLRRAAFAFGMGRR